MRTTMEPGALERTRPTEAPAPDVRNGTDESWRAFYWLAAAAAALIVVVALIDIGLMAFEEAAAAPGTSDAVSWFVLLREHPFLGLRNLGILNIANTLLEIPLFLALYHLHRQQQPFAALALVMLAVGTAVYIASNSLFTMFALSIRYAAAGPGELASVVAAGQAALALGEDLTPGMFMGFFLTEVAGLVMVAVMLRERIFARWIGLVGLVGFGALLVFNTFAAFLPAAYGAALALGGGGGLLMVTWYVAVARRLFRLAQRS